MMNEAFLIDTEEKRLSILTQAERAVQLALHQYDLDGECDVHYLQLSDHITYRIETGTGLRLLLRIHPEATPLAEIQSELAWLEALSTHEGLLVPTAFSNRAGAYVTEVTTEEGFRGWITVMRWIEGEHHNEDLAEDLIRKMGALMAKLHEATTGFVPSVDFTRPAWGQQSFEKQFAQLKLYYRNFISDDQFPLYEQAADKIINHFEKLRDSDFAYGMIHADMHIGNLVFYNDEPYPIDFGRCGFGYELYDVAQALVGLYPLQRQQFIEAYSDVRKLDGEYIAALESFFIMSIIENYSFHAPNPLESEDMRAQQPYAQALMRHYLNGSPFLFNRIELS